LHTAVVTVKMAPGAIGELIVDDPLPYPLRLLGEEDDRGYTWGRQRSAVFLSSDAVKMTGELRLPEGTLSISEVVEVEIANWIHNALTAEQTN
jgi:hypothetical protein